MHYSESHTFHVRSAALMIKQHLEKYPFKYKTCHELMENMATTNRRLVEAAFKAEYGVTIKNYQTKQRMNVAKKYLYEGIPIKRVATKCYYLSQSAFTRAFKNEIKLTPTQWLQRYH